MANVDRFDGYSKSKDEVFSVDNEARHVKFLANTSYYIECFLKPNQKWNNETPWKQRIDLVRYADVDWQAISNHIKEMKYQDFLATPYWKAITSHKKYKAGYRCQLCNYGRNLVTHHRNYDIHGREHSHLDELIVLCNNCHQQFHNKNRIDRSRSEDFSEVFIMLGVVTLLIGLIAFCLHQS